MMNVYVSSEANDALREMYPSVFTFYRPKSGGVLKYALFNNELTDEDVFLLRLKFAAKDLAIYPYDTITLGT